MPDYKEWSGTASGWRRAFAVHLNNPQGHPERRSVSFEEEDVFTTPDGRLTRTPAGGLAAGFVATDTFALFDPETGAPTGATATHADVYGLLDCLYIDLALKRDAAMAAAAAGPPTATTPTTPTTTPGATP